MAKKSELQATNILRRLYTGMPHTDTVTKDAIYRALGRDEHNQKDRDALYTMLSIVRHYEFITTTKDPTHQNSLVSITLTDKGRQALGRSQVDTNTASAPQPADGISQSQKDQFQTVTIIDGITLSYKQEFTLDLLTNAQFATALKDLKSALSPALGSNDLGSSRGGHI
jgi:hypothetical protein